MFRTRGRRPSPAVLIALLALVLSVAGPALAHDASGFAARVISGRTIKQHSISGVRLKNNTLTGLQIDEAKLGPVPTAANAVTAQTATSALNAVNAASAGTAASATTAGSAGELAGHARFFERASATSGASLTAALAASPELPLAQVGAVGLYARCLRDTSGGPDVHALIYVRSTVPGGVLDGPDSKLQGSTAGDTLGPATAEPGRQIRSVTAAGPDAARFAGGAPGAFSLVTGDGVAFSGQVALGAQEGAPPGAATAFAAGSGCIFSGTLERTGG